MTIYAMSLGGGGSPFYTVRTIKNQGLYTIRGVAPGNYYLLAVPTAGFGSPPQHFAGAYTKAVACGLAYGCNDHTLVPVSVSPGGMVTGISVTDFYAGANAFPLVPEAGPTAATFPSASPSYADAVAAARYEGQRGTGASTVLSSAIDQCPMNDTCIALEQQHDGTRSAYFDAHAGSNSEMVACGVYVFQDAVGWHPLNTACGVYPVPGRSLPATFMGSGCINVRVYPGYTSKIVECLPVDTLVTIDRGPVFLQEATPSDAANLNRLWWHLVSHGWMVHQYLTGVFNVE